MTTRDSSFRPSGPCSRHRQNRTVPSTPSKPGLAPSGGRCVFCWVVTGQSGRRKPPGPSPSGGFPGIEEQRTEAAGTGGELAPSGRQWHLSYYFPASPFPQEGGEWRAVMWMTGCDCVYTLGGDGAQLCQCEPVTHLPAGLCPLVVP